MSAQVRAALVRLRRKVRASGRHSEKAGAVSSVYAFTFVDELLDAEFAKLDRPKKRVTKKAAPKK